MSKRARRLWLGDWQRDDAAEPAQDDTVVILPDEEGEVEPQDHQRRNRQRAVATAAAATVLAALALTLFSGDDEKLRTTAAQAPPAQSPQAQPQVPAPQLPQVPQGGGGGFGGPDLTGPAATKAAKAALSKFPGDIERVTAGPGGGGYVVHVIEGDGNEVHVVVSDEFKVLGSDADRGGPGFGGGGTGPPSGSTNSS
jgi:hypothetical protein